MFFIPYDNIFTEEMEEDYVINMYSLYLFIKLVCGHPKRTKYALSLNSRTYVYHEYVCGIGI